MARDPGAEDHIKLESNTYKIVLDDTAKLTIGADDIIPGVPIHSATVSTVVLSASTAQTTLNANQHFTVANATTANFGIVLPAVATSVGRTYTVKKIDAGANIVYLSASSGEYIENVAEIGIASRNESLSVTSDGVVWRITGRYSGSL